MSLEADYRQLLDVYQAAVGRADVAGIAALFTEDAIFLAPGQSALNGPAAIRADYAAAIGEGYEVAMHIVECHDCGTFAYGSGTFEYDGGAGNWLHVLRRLEDGSLRIHRLCWN